MLSFEVENMESRKAIMSRIKYIYNEILEACYGFKIFFKISNLCVGYIYRNLDFVG